MYFSKRNRFSKRSSISQSKKHKSNKITEKELKDAQNNIGNISYDSDMTIYQDYLHLLLIKTSDKFIQDRYFNYMQKVNQGKQRKQNFFQRMERDINKREDSKRGKDEEKVTEQSALNNFA